MKVILREDVAKLGKLGDIIEVKDGYARNYLIPRKLAVAATRHSLGQLDHEKRLIGDVQKKRLSKAQKFAEQISGHALSIPVQVGDQDKLFGAVLAKDIADALRRDGLEVDRHQIQLEEPLKQLGVFTVPVRLGEGVEAQLKVELIRK